MESTDGFGWRGRGRSFHIEGPKTEKTWGTNSGKSGTRNLEADSIKQSEKYQESTHRDRTNTDDCPMYNF